jgi:hypothetical protein
MTDSIGKLAAALAKAQSEIKGAKKDAENPFFKSSYADLASTWEACREALSKNELAIAQTTEIHDGTIVLKTILMHSSGESITGILPVLVGEKASSQQLGSTITYNRRYALAAMVGVAPEDDDGNTASETAGKTTFKKPTMPPSLKDKATTFAAQIDAQTTEKALKSWLPDWFDRLGLKISQAQEAFRMADAAE